MDIKLRFFNSSEGRERTDIVLYQTNRSHDFAELPIAWKVIRQCGFGNYHPFIFPEKTEISASDAFGNFTPHLDCLPGQAFHVVCTGSGNELKFAGPSSSVLDMELRNDLDRGSINANIFKAGLLFSRKTMIAPGQKAIFRFNPSLFIGAVQSVEEGAGLNAAIISAQKTELSLLGVAAADIHMVGGGAGSSARAYRFLMENIQWA